MGSEFYVMMDFIIAMCGVYVVYQYIMMVKNKTILQNSLLPKDLDVKKCKDPEGYIKYIGIKQLIFGLAAAIYGASGVIQNYFDMFNMTLSLTLTGIFLVITIWYAIVSNKAVKKYWDKK